MKIRLLQLGILFLFSVLENLNAQVFLSESFNGNTIPGTWTVSDSGTGPARWMVHAPTTNLGMLNSNYLVVNSDSGGNNNTTTANEIITSPVIGVTGSGPLFLSLHQVFRKAGAARLDTGWIEVFQNGSWQGLRKISANIGQPNTPRKDTIDISAFAGPELRIRFRYKSKRGLFWAIDNIKVFTPPAGDVGVSSLIANPGNCGLSLPYSPVILITNHGTEPRSGFPVEYQSGNQNLVSEQFSGTINPGSTAQFTFATPITQGISAFRAWTSLSDDGDRFNDTLSATLPFAPSNLANVDFSSFDGVNLTATNPGWVEQTGFNPTGTSSAWGVSTTAQTTGLGSQTARINLYTIGKREWIISPAISVAPAMAIKYKVAISDWNNPGTDEMGSDDSLIVKITTNCGQTWTRLKYYTVADNLSNVLNEQSISLAGFAGQTVRIAFYASEGNTDDANDYDVHIDDIGLSIVSQNDLQLASLLIPSGNCGAGPSFPVRVRIVNSGSLPQTTAPISYQVAGQAAVSQTFPVNLAPGTDTILEFSAPVAITTPGNYSISSWISLPLDSNRLNDTIKNKPFFRPFPSFPVQLFTGFDGSNINGGWQEFSGTPQSLITGSAWANSNAAQITGLGSETARINLYTTGKREWIISPPITAGAALALKFKIAVTNWTTAETDEMGSDDSLIVKITTNCGQTWQNLASFTAADNLSNELTEKTVSLTAFAGQTLRLAFYATEGSTDDDNDYDLHIDDIGLGIVSQNDLQLASLLIPAGSCGAPPSFPVRVKVVNSGSLPQTTAPISYQVAGQAAVSQTFPVNLAPGSDTILEFNTPVAIPASGNYSISSWISLPLDSNRLNDTIKNKPFLRPLGTFATQTFTGFTGTNLTGGWQEFAGLAPNLVAGSAWTSATTTQATALGSETAKINLFTTGKRDWIISPPVSLSTGKALRFKLALTNYNAITAASMGSDDSLIVRISSNCGQSWQNLRVFTDADNLTNQLTEFNLNLNAFLGQTIRIGFYASEGSTAGSEDVDLHLDNIELVNLSPNDVGVTELIVPSAECGLPPSFPVKMKIANFGTQPQSGFGVNYSVNGGAVVSASFSGTLAPGQTSLYEFSQPLSITQAGVFIITGWTSLSGDQDIFNDSLSSQPLSPTVDSLLEVGFNGFNGNNVDSLFPGWREKSGHTPAGNTSTWTSATGSQATTLGSNTARVMLSNQAARREWLISPGFLVKPSMTLSFRIALTAANTGTAASLGSDDSLVVLISNNCGQTWTILKAFTAQSNIPNSLVTQNVSLTGYDGQNCQIGFKATTGLVANIQASSIHLDSIRAGNIILTSLQEPLVTGTKTLRVFPNPISGGILHVDFPESRMQPRFYSVMGREYFPVVISNEGNRFDVSAFPSGMYYIRIKNGASAGFVIP